METRNRVKKNCLTLKIAFGKAKANQHFEGENDLDVYADGAGLTFSRRKSEPTSPFERKIAPIMREDSQNNTTQIKQLVVRLYKCQDSKLFYGFTQQHAETFQRIIAGNISSHRESSVMKKAIDSNSIPTNDEIDTHILSIYLNGHKNDVPGALPGFNLYPPTDKDNIVAPPDVNEWQKKKESNLILNGLRPSQIPPTAVGNYNLQNAVTINSIVGIVFKIHLIGNDEVSALIKGELNNESTMLEVMNECDVASDFNITDIEDCKFLIKKKSGSYLKLKYSQFYDMTVNEFVRISNIHEDYTIELKY